MRVLIVEDDKKKAKHLFDHVHRTVPQANIEERSSYRGGLREIVDTQPDIIILDMSMPTFDVSNKDRGGRTRAYAGRDILEEMRRRKISGMVIVITQFETFGEGEDRKTLEQLKSELARDFAATYCGAVYYHPAQSNWQEELTTLIGKLTKGTSL